MRELPIGAELVRGGVHFRVWAPRCKKVEVFLDNGSSFPLNAEKNGYFSGTVKNVKQGALYQFRLDNGEQLFPDPASRFQPQGPHGPSQVMDPKSFKWFDSRWKGIIDKAKVVLYELHVGTFTQEGTWLSALEKLPHLKDLGINVIEMMPINEWPGRFNWGYDGVNLYAPTHNYGHPDDLKAFINEAHKWGIGVILDVVYNHFGPDGNFLTQFSDLYFKRENNEWGAHINFDEEGSEEVRAFFIENAGYWIDEFHFDGLRLDACHSINDTTSPHIFLEIVQKVRKKGGRRATYVTAENEKQESKFLFSKKQGGYEFDAIWNEDFHHAAFVRLTGRNEAYFTDYLGKAQEFVAALKYNFLYQGQWYSWQKQRRGSPALDIEPQHFVHFLENHDQIANTGSAQRLHQLSHSRVYRALTTLLLLSPQIPLLFQGQEFGSSSPFYFFCEHSKELAALVKKGRLKFISQFKSLNDPEVKKRIPLPNEESTFTKSKLDWNEKERNHFLYQLHKDLIEMRTNDAVFGDVKERKIDAAVLNADAFLVRYFSAEGERLLIINLGIDLFIEPSPEPLLAPPLGHEWKMQWSTELPQYGGFGCREVPEKGNWNITGFSACIFHPEKIESLHE